MKKSLTPSLALLSVLLIGCSPTGTVVVNEVPMYGGMDRQAIPKLHAADQTLIKGASHAFGGREKAAQAWVNQGFKFYKQGDLAKSMKRFNQAWLLDPKNPEIYWGFGTIMQTQNHRPVSDITAMYEKAYNLGLRNPDLLERLAAVR